jgi:proteic killer suppression protein
MIRSIRHKGLKRLYEDDDPRGVIPEHVEKLRDILDALDTSLAIEGMDLPGLRLHQLKGELKAYGRSLFARIGGWYFAFPIRMRLKSIIWTTTERSDSHADEEPTASRRRCLALMH